MNPLINFAVPQNDSTQIYNAGDVELGTVQTQGQGVYYIKSRSSEVPCQQPGTKSGTSFMGIRDTESAAITYYKFDSRMKLVENTVESPARVKSYAHGNNGVCPLTPKTFTNDGTCIQRRNDVCTPLVFSAGTIIKLDRNTLRKFYTVSQRYVYAIKGLRLLDSTSGFHRRSPCQQGYIDKYRTPEGRARFIRTNGTCPSDSKWLPTDGTGAVILAALRNETGPNTGDIRDIAAWKFTASNGGICSESEDAIGASIDLDGDCWTQVHPHEQNVYDCTTWVMTHPGNNNAQDSGHRNPIAKWAMNGYPEVHFPEWHPQDRWDESNLKWNQEDFKFMGTWGAEVDFSTFPTRIQTQAMAQELGVQRILNHSLTFEACGSRGEVQNDPSRGHAYLFMTFRQVAEEGLDRSYNFHSGGPSDLWTNAVLRAPDQLRHRVAWALSQFVVATSSDLSKVEDIATFYDIFLMHAFGNFRGIIREISQNPVMAKYLTFENNKKHSGGVYPDENFARELMQLFTIGLYKLNMDGTRQKNPKTGEPIPTYDNDDVMSFARIWTGWSSQFVQVGRHDGASRSNVQSNQVDPMKLASKDRDTFPKTSLNGGYLGDGYPLCSAQPARAFLLKGAHYQKTGARSSLKLTYAVDSNDDPIGEFVDESSGFGGKIREHFAPDLSSKLYETICSRNSTAGDCIFPKDVYLPATIPCTGKVECGADILHVVKMVDGDRYEFYKYIEPLCVDLQFFKDGKTTNWGYETRINWGVRNNQDQCTDPHLLTRAGVTCCKTADP